MHSIVCLGGCPERPRPGSDPIRQPACTEGHSDCKDIIIFLQPYTVTVEYRAMPVSARCVDRTLMVDGNRLQPTRTDCAIGHRAGLAARQTAWSAGVGPRSHTDGGRGYSRPLVPAAERALRPRPWRPDCGSPPASHPRMHFAASLSDGILWQCSYQASGRTVRPVKVWMRLPTR